MKINIMLPIKNLKGDQFPVDPNLPNGIKMVLADVLTNALLAQSYPPGSSYPAGESVKRYSLSLAIYRAQTNAPVLVSDEPGERQSGITEVDIDSTMAAALKTDIERMYGPIVAGQVLPILDGN